MPNHLPMLIVYSGLPGSGKTTWRQAHDDGATVVCLDDIRQELTGDAARQDENYRVVRVASDRVRDALARGEDVLVDATNLTRSYRARWVAIANELGAPARSVYFPCSVEDALAHNALRERRVPDDAILRMARRMQVPSATEGFAEQVVVPPARVSELVGRIRAGESSAEAPLAPEGFHARAEKNHRTSRPEG